MKRSAAPTAKYQSQRNHEINYGYKRVAPQRAATQHFEISSQSSQDPADTVNLAIDTSQPFRQFTVVYAQKSNRKHKRWEDDGVLTAQDGKLLLENVENGRRRVAASYHNNKLELTYLSAGHQLKIGGFEVEIQDEILQQKISEHLIRCAPTDLQSLIYERISQDIITLDEETVNDFLTRLYSHPVVLYVRLHQLFSLNQESIEIPRILDSFPPCYNYASVCVDESGKLNELFKLVAGFDDAHEKAMIVSNSLSSLDLIESMFSAASFEVFRLDGKSTSVKEDHIKTFNSVDLTEEPPSMVLLMHADTTTCGIDIHGTTRLILFDAECWAPGRDVVSRVWRTGHEKTCHVYRLINVGTFEDETSQTEPPAVQEEDIILC